MRYLGADPAVPADETERMTTRMLLRRVNKILDARA